MISLLVATLAWAQDCEVYSGELLVGVDESPPFAMKKNGKWVGISVDLWEKIALENHLNYRYISEPFNQILEDVADCDLDVGLPGITITAEREMKMDFSHTYLVEDVAVATSAKQDYWSVSKIILKKLSYPIAFLLSVLGAAGIIYAILEGKGKSVRGFFDSMYWAMTTLVTVGYGDEAPRNLSGRGFAMVWMFLAVFFIASINAQIYGVFNEISWTAEVDDLTDLRGKTVYTAAGTFSEDLLKANQVEYQAFPTEEEAIRVFLKTPRSFIVYDRSILNYYLEDKTMILENGFFDQHLAFALRNNFPFQEDVNRSLLSDTQTEWWKTTTFKYNIKEVK